MSAGSKSHEGVFRTSKLVSFIGILAILIASFRIVTSVIDANNNENFWEGSKVAAENGALTISHMNEAIGYGGLIHSFKNAVLRNDASSLENVELQYQKLQDVITQYIAEPYVTEGEREAYLQVLAVFTEYMENAREIPGLYAQGFSIKEIDDQVKIDDRAAIVAIASIEAEWVARQSVFRGSMQRCLSDLRNAALSGAFLVLLLCLVIFGSILTTRGLSKVLLALKSENERREEAEAGLLKRTTELARSNKDLQRFAYVASHDLRSPLRAVSNLATWMEEDLGDKLDGDAKEHMVMMKSRISRLDSLLKDLLEYSQAASTIEKSECLDLDKIIDDVRSILIITDNESVICTTPMPKIIAPKAVISLVIRNLVNNALKHHDMDEKRIEISATKTSSFCKICVIDNGPGIPAKYHEKIFEMFTTLQSRDVVEGSGMGLALIKRQVQNYGGDIIVESPLNNERGTRFTLEWPI
jgi:signal transduction histidine kinase